MAVDAGAGSVVLALDSFKGSIGAVEACAAVAAGWREVDPDARVVARPMADGGEGTLDAFAAAVPGAQRIPLVVMGPAGEAVEASWLLLPPTPEAPEGTAVVELASTSGIELLTTTGVGLRPWDAATTGFGQAIAAALDHGVSRLVLGIGSSASTDAGVGMLTSLGASFRDVRGDAVAPGARGLAAIAEVDLTGLRPLPPGGATVLSDVTNPLIGRRGAAAVFGPQKGLGPAGVAAVDAELARVAELVRVALEREPFATDASAGGAARSDSGAADLHPADPRAPGSGAAGGTGFALRVWGAQLRPGSAEVAALIGLADAVGEASVVVTGEGSYDGQSAAGKAPAHVAALAADAGVPIALVAGRIAPDADTAPFAAAASLTELAGSGDAALTDPERWLRDAGAVLARTLRRPG